MSSGGVHFPQGRVFGSHEATKPRRREKGGQTEVWSMNLRALEPARGPCRGRVPCARVPGVALRSTPGRFFGSHEGTKPRRREKGGQTEVQSIGLHALEPTWGPCRGRVPCARVPGVALRSTPGRVFGSHEGTKPRRREKGGQTEVWSMNLRALEPVGGLCRVR
jgi:hypothetical protein